MRVAESPRVRLERLSTQPFPPRLAKLGALLRKVPIGTPFKGRVARWALGEQIHLTDVVLPLENGLKFCVPSLSHSIAFRLLIDGIYEADSMRALESRCGKGSVFVDVGANIGTFTIPFSRRLGESGKVIAIEASPKCLPYLDYNLSLNGVNNVFVLPYFAFKHSGHVQFFEAPATHFGMGSCGPQFSAPPIQVSSRTLDEILAAQNIDHVDAIKVDVEGAECDVFLGAERLLSSKTPPLVLFENVPWATLRANHSELAAQDILRRFGFKIFGLQDYLHDADPIPSGAVSSSEMLVAVR